MKIGFVSAILDGLGLSTNHLHRKPNWVSVRRGCLLATRERANEGTPE